MTYYEDVNIWSLDGEPLVVAEDHDHLGLIVSGQDEEMKNVGKTNALQSSWNYIFP